jgi:hypothetical protein
MEFLVWRTALKGRNYAFAMIPPPMQVGDEFHGWRQQTITGLMDLRTLIMVRTTISVTISPWGNKGQLLLILIEFGPQESH